MKGIEGLLKLEAAVARDFERLNHPPADWVPPRAGPDGPRMVDVAIVGGGMCGLAASAFALRRVGVSNLRQVDRSPEGREGAVADVCPHGDPAVAEAPHRAGAGDGRAHLSGVVGGRGARLGRARPDPHGGLGGLSRLAPPGDRRAGRERRRSGRARAGFGWRPGAARRAARGGDDPRPARGPRDRARGAGGAAGAGAARPVPGRFGPAQRGRHRLRRPLGPPGRGRRARRHRLRQRGGGARGGGGGGGADRARSGPSPAQQDEADRLSRLLSRLSDPAGRGEAALARPRGAAADCAAARLGASHLVSIRGCG